MSRYELHTVHPHDGGRTGSIVFRAGTVGQALAMAHQLAGDRPVELWQDDRRLCRIQRSRRQPDDAAFWMVS
jgi:hypothetical protein